MIASRLLRRAALAAIFTCLAAAWPALATEAELSRRGYYSDPAFNGESIVFTSEGDLWTVSIHGGVARRLTTAPGAEQRAIFSPDGKTIAFQAEYEGPAEVYTMPAEGGLPQRQSWNGDARPAAYTPDGRLAIQTGRYSTLPGMHLVLIDQKGNHEIVPLDEAAQAAWSADGKTLFFTRWRRQSSETKRYKGGWAENLWRWDGGSSEAVPLTADFDGTSRQPMFFKDRVYFASDRDGIMNLWSMDANGKNLRQESHQKIFDVLGASLAGGKIVYAAAGDLWLLDLATGKEEVLPVTLSSDFDQLREHWVTKPADFLTAAHISPDGSSAVFTARGEVFVAPAKPGRIVKVAGDSSIRYREARFLPDGKSILALSSKTGETEFWRYPANGIGAPEQWTRDAKVFRRDGLVSPDGKWLASTDKDQQLWLYDIQQKTSKRIAQSPNGEYGNLRWSPDSRWLAWAETADNQFQRIQVLELANGKVHPITSDRFNSIDPTWSADGKWLYFLSDRNLKTTVYSPWGPREPEPHFDRTAKMYELALTEGLRSPFLPADELHPESEKDKEKDAEKKSDEAKKDEAKKNGDKTGAAKKSGDKAEKKDEKKDDKKDEKKPPEVKIDFEGLASRLNEVPLPAGNYDGLEAAEKRLCWLDSKDETGQHVALQCMDVANKGDEPDTVVGEVQGFELSADRKKMLIARKDDFLIVDADAHTLSDPKALAKAQVSLSRWTITTNPRQEFRSIFLDAWLMERDFFYDRHMNGVDWPAMRDRYLPLVDRVATREELNAVLAQMVSELSALHIFVRGGDARESADHIGLASLGARLRRDEKAGGFVVEHVYAYDPDLPNTAPPLARPEVNVKEGETILSIDGTDLLTVADERALLRGKAGAQVMLKVKSAKGETRDVLATPIKAGDEAQLRYDEWELTRRQAVEKASSGKIGYVHLRNMSADDMNQWARDFYPVFDRQGLIIDVRHNHGGNIDSWLLSKLLRQAWFYWQPRVGSPSWNMHYAFRGHIVVLCDHETASDGEAFSEGFKRLGLGKVIGKRTWGGEIWLSSDTQQADNGIATAAETGVYADGKWLIEGRGVEPDIEVDNLPHATFTGADAQLDAALALLQKQIQADPRPVPPAPAYPDKSFHPLP
jgi:tricorn protease